MNSRWRCYIIGGGLTTTGGIVGGGVTTTGGIVGGAVESPGGLDGGVLGELVGVFSPSLPPKRSASGRLPSNCCGLTKSFLATRPRPLWVFGKSVKKVSTPHQAAYSVTSQLAIAKGEIIKVVITAAITGFNLSFFIFNIL